MTSNQEVLKGSRWLKKEALHHRLDHHKALFCHGADSRIRIVFLAADIV